eukprot:m.202419 g.202419  ORF g.202419 m.202419 type:complete len:143 (+) comp17064_c0_seq25:163-591(+)
MPEQVRLPLEPAVSLNATLACTLIGCELLSSAPTVKATPEELRVLTNDTCARRCRQSLATGAQVSITHSHPQFCKHIVWTVDIYGFDRNDAYLPLPPISKLSSSFEWWTALIVSAGLVACTIAAYLGRQDGLVRYATEPFKF